MKLPSEQEIMELVVETLNLEVDESFNASTHLFGDAGEGALGLDSIDALEIGAIVKQRYDVKMKADDEASRNAMICVKNLHEFICKTMNDANTEQTENAAVA